MKRTLVSALLVAALTGSALAQANILNGGGDQNSPSATVYPQSWLKDSSQPQGRSSSKKGILKSGSEMEAEEESMPVARVSSKAAVVPEPGTMIALGAGALALMARRKKKA